VVSAGAFEKGYRDAGSVGLRRGIDHEDLGHLAVTA
jgi:hypothetical protein